MNKTKKKLPALIVDKEGLARKLADRPKAFVLFELIQNALDENITQVSVSTRMYKGTCLIMVKDDAPDGFQNLESIYTMYRDSKKAQDPTKRGRWEIGEKLVVALADEMKVSTTKGTIHFKNNERVSSNEKTKEGSIVNVKIKMSKEEYLDMQKQIKLLLPLENGPTIVYNGTVFPSRTPVEKINIPLQTVVADSDRVLRTTKRKTDVLIYEVKEDEEAHIYEMGIPVVKTGDRYHYDVQQRVPVNWERNNVPPSFLKELRAGVLNAMSNCLTEDEVTDTWVQNSLERANQEAIENVLNKQYGEKRVIFDPSDPEGTKLAHSQGYTIIPPRAFSKPTWQKIREYGAALPAGQVTPSPKPYSNDPNALPEKLIPESEWTPAMLRISDFVQKLGIALFNCSVSVRMINEPINCKFRAVFCKLSNQNVEMGFNVGRLGKDWFEKGYDNKEIKKLVIHEFGHYFSSDHLSSKYHDGLCEIAACMSDLYSNCPNFPIQLITDLNWPVGLCKN